MAATTERPARWYTTRDAFKEIAFGSTTITDKDARIDRLIARASAWIERFTGRHFIPTIATKEYDFQQTVQLYFDDDLISLTTLKYETTTIAASDYFLYPLNAADEGKPYLWVELLYTDALFSYSDTRQSALTVIGKWGYSEITYLRTTVDETYSASDTTLTVASATGIEVGATLLIESEQLFVSNVSALSLTVVRAMNGTTAASHASGTSIYLMTAPEDVKMACELVVGKWLHRLDAALIDTVGASEGGFRITASSVDKEAIQLLRPYRRMMKRPPRYMGARSSFGRWPYNRGMRLDE